MNGLKPNCLFSPPEEERSSRPPSRSTDRPRSRSDYDRDPRDPRDPYPRDPRDPYQRGYDGYGQGHGDYYYDDRERFYRYYNRDSRYRHGYAEEMGQYYGHYDR